MTGERRTARPELLVQRLLEVRRLLDAYDRVAPDDRHGFADLATLRELAGRYDYMQAGIMAAADVLAELITAGRRGRLDHGHQVFVDDVSDALLDLGYEPWPEYDGSVGWTWPRLQKGDGDAVEAGR